MVRFGTFEFEPETGELRRNGGGAGAGTVRLEPQPARALALLVARAGDIVTREELKAALWGDDTHVDFDRGLAYCISQVRAALGDAADNPRFVETLPRRGFRFIAPVTAAEQNRPPYGELAAQQTGPPYDTRPPYGRLAVAVVLMAAVAAAAWWWSVDRRPVLAVAIFDNETGRPELDRFTTGLSDALVAHLGQLDAARIGIVGNARALRMPRSFRDLNEIRETTGASHIILAQLQNTDTGLRLIAHLIRLSDGRHVWVKRFNRPAHVEGLADLEQQLLTEATIGVREQVMQVAAGGGK